MTKLLKEQMLRVNFTLKEKRDQNQPARKAKATHSAAHYTTPITSKSLREPCDTVHQGACSCAVFT